MTPVEIRPLRPEDDVAGFESGDPDLDRFLKKYAGKNQFRHHIGTTYVAVHRDKIVGFATVVAASIHVDHIPAKLRKRLPRNPLPALRLARLAVDRRLQRQGIGRQLLRAVFLLAQEMATRVRCVGVLVDSKPDAVEFYRRHGFKELEIIEGRLGDRPAPVGMFLPLASLQGNRAEQQGTTCR